MQSKRNMFYMHHSFLTGMLIFIVFGRYMHNLLRIEDCIEATKLHRGILTQSTELSPSSAHEEEN